MSNPTPTPWVDDGKGIVGWYGELRCCNHPKAICERINERTGECIEWREECCGFPDCDQALVANASPEDAAFIVRAVNSHAALVEALEHARHVMWEYGFSEDDLQPIRAALALAQEPKP